MLYYFDFTVWFKLLRLVGQEPNSRRRRGLYKLLLLHVPLRAAFTAVCFFLDGILFPGLWRTRVKSGARASRRQSLSSATHAAAPRSPTG